MKYETYASNCCQELQVSQEAFSRRYEINSYENWFYPQASAILKLYSEGKEVHFSALAVGSFSRNTNTWMWAWANNHYSESNKFQTLRIKEFGQENGYERLISPRFEGDEYTGWELTAIAWNLLGGIGTYRVVSDHLEIYFLLTGEVSKEEVDEMEGKLVECRVHGTSRAAFVCQHLNTTTRTGFEEAFETYRGMELSEEDDFQAWCAECETERSRTNGWNDESMEFANIRVLCEGCYVDIKEFNAENS